jgi:hypothetical protein
LASVFVLAGKPDSGERAMNRLSDTPTGPDAIAGTGEEFLAQIKSISERARKESAFVALMNLQMARTEAENNFTKKVGEAAKSASS